MGNLVHNWYLLHNLDVTPVNPGSSSVTVGGKDYPTISNLKGLANPTLTGVSIITHPAVTINVLKEAKDVGVRALWLQPGTFDDEVIKYATTNGNFDAVVYGDGGAGGEGWCVLVDGERALKAAKL